MTYPPPPHFLPPPLSTWCLVEVPCLSLLAVPGELLLSSGPVKHRVGHVYFLFLPLVGSQSPVSEESAGSVFSRGCMERFLIFWVVWSLLAISSMSETEVDEDEDEEDQDEETYARHQGIGQIFVPRDINHH